MTTIDEKLDKFYLIFQEKDKQIDEKNIIISNNINNENKSQESLIPFVNVGSSFVKNNENKNNNKRFITSFLRKSQISH